MWEPRRLRTLRASTACYEDSFKSTVLWDVKLCSLEDVEVSEEYTAYIFRVEE
jgi:hypothetical protein